MEAYQQGYDDRNLGIIVCPYQVDSMAAKAWFEGWCAADDVRAARGRSA